MHVHVFVLFSSISHFHIFALIFHFVTRFAPTGTTTSTAGTKAITNRIKKGNSNQQHKRSNERHEDNKPCCTVCVFEVWN